MAPEQNAAPAKTPWRKIFTAFKIALDLKKLTLAALGIFFLWIGWLCISWTFYGTRTFPEWKNYEDTTKVEPADKKAQWDYFRAKRESWNLIHELAGDPDDHRLVDAGDIADSPEEFALISDWEQGWRRGDDVVTLKDKGTLMRIARLGSDNRITVSEYKIALADPTAKLPEKFPLRSVTVLDAENKQISIKGVPVTVEDRFKELKDHLQTMYTLAQIDEKARVIPDRDLADRALSKFHGYIVTNPKMKASGLLRISPWSENRGGNPYLLVSDTLKAGGRTDTPTTQLLYWLYNVEVPVLLEPLVKFLRPLLYIFDSRAGFWDRLYLVFIILWTLAVWGFFGGAICRIAAVQFARNERIPLKEAILFTKDRFVSFFAAPVFPLLLVALFVLLLMIFGWVEWIPWVGDLFAGVLWPVVLIFGFIIAIVLIGMVGWPLMVATISTEGTDSFDALSRSYSYVYQATWNYLWYCLLAVAYGVVLVFFVGFIASLMVFLGKWGVSSAVGLADSDPKYDREPSYLFAYAPTSFGWRDLLISGNTRFTEEKTEISYDGRLVTHLDFKPEYELSFMNKVGAFLVACWIYPLFLIVVGFGYSYFWTASTIVYFLMRHKVDDTELDEVHLEDEELEDPFLKQTPPPAPPPVSKPGTVSLNVVEAPPKPVTSYTADEQPPPPPPTEASAPPPENPPPETAPPPPPPENPPPA